MLCVQGEVPRLRDSWSTAELGFRVWVLRAYGAGP